MFDMIASIASAREDSSLKLCYDGDNEFRN